MSKLYLYTLTLYPHYPARTVCPYVGVDPKRYVPTIG